MTALFYMSDPSPVSDLAYTDTAPGLPHINDDVHILCIILMNVVTPTTKAEAGAVLLIVKTPSRFATPLKARDTHNRLL